jgi:N utilization substance protein B
MSARRKARKRALDLLFESDLRGTNPVELLTSRPVPDLSEAEYVAVLINGIAEHKQKIDEFINTYAEGWDMDRMPAVDRNLLRVALFEILWQESLDDQIAANEAVELASELSTKDSAAYINGVLGRIIALKAVLPL